MSLKRRPCPVAHCVRIRRLANCCSFLTPSSQLFPFRDETMHLQSAICIGEPQQLSASQVRALLSPTSRRWGPACLRLAGGDRRAQGLGGTERGSMATGWKQGEARPVRLIPVSVSAGRGPGGNDCGPAWKVAARLGVGRCVCYVEVQERRRSWATPGKGRLAGELAGRS